MPFTAWKHTERNRQRDRKKYVMISWGFVISAVQNNSLSGGFWVRPAQRKVVKIRKFDFSYWASSTPWGHVLSLKTFCRNPVLSWAIRYSVFQKVKFTSIWSSCATIRFQLFDIWWSCLDKENYFKAISRMVFFRFGEIINIMILSFVKKNFFDFFFNSL